LPGGAARCGTGAALPAGLGVELDQLTVDELEEAAVDRIVGGMGPAGDVVGQHGGELVVALGESRRDQQIPLRNADQDAFRRSEVRSETTIGPAAAR
jgi:hypothetical protein